MARRERQHISGGPTSALTMPAHELQVGPLSEISQRNIINLSRSGHVRFLQDSINEAADILTMTAGMMNERYVNAKNRLESNKRKRAEKGMDDSEAIMEADAKVRKMGQSVEAKNAQLEEKMRVIVDEDYRTENLTQVLELVVRGTEANATQGRQAQGRNNVEAQEKVTDTTSASDNYAMRMENRISQWQKLSLTARYSRNNHYIGYYKMVHDAKYPGDDAPPVPHASTWFRHMEDGTTRDNGQESDDDIAIEREKVSLRCPLTFLTFKDPVTSTKCPHSFERTAIEDMITKSSYMLTLPRGHPRQGQRGRYVKCPVCELPLTKEDLRPDPVLLRKVRRQTQKEDDEAEDNAMSVDYKSSGSANKASNRIVKSEPEPNVIPGTQYANDDDDDDDNNNNYDDDDASGDD